MTIIRALLDRVVSALDTRPRSTAAWNPPRRWPTKKERKQLATDIERVCFYQGAEFTRELVTFACHEFPRSGLLYSGLRRDYERDFQ